MDYEIVEKNGKLYRKFKRGMLPIRPVSDKYNHLPNYAGVYSITCLTSGKKYIGSAKDVRKRAQSHSLEVLRLKGADINNLSFELIEDCKYLTTKQRFELEREWINKLNTLFPNGFNKIYPYMKDYARGPKKPTGPKKPGFKASYYWLNGERFVQYEAR